MLLSMKQTMKPSTLRTTQTGCQKNARSATKLHVLVGPLMLPPKRDSQEAESSVEHLCAEVSISFYVKLSNVGSIFAAYFG